MAVFRKLLYAFVMLAAVVAVTAWNARIMALTSSFSPEIGFEPSNGSGNDGLREERLTELEDMHSIAIEVDPSQATFNKAQPDLCSRKTFPKAMGSQKTSSIAGSNKEIEEQSDVASAKTFPKATGAGAPIVSQQGLKKKYQKNRKLIEVAPKSSPIAGSNKEKEKHSDVASTNFPKAMGAGAPTMSPQGLKKKYHKHRNLIEVDPSQATFNKAQPDLCSRKTFPKAMGSQKTSSIADYNKEIEEQSDVASAKTFPKATGAGAPIVSQQGLKKKYQKNRKFIEVAPETSPIAGSYKEKEKHSDVASTNFPKAMGAGAPIVSQQGLKKKYHKNRKLIEVALETSPIAGSNKQVDEQSDVSSAKGHPEAMGADVAGSNKEIKEQSDVASTKAFAKARDGGAPIMSQQGLKKKYNKHRKLVGVPPVTSPIAGSNMEIGQSGVASAKGFAKAMGPVAMPPLTAKGPVDSNN